MIKHSTQEVLAHVRHLVSADPQVHVDPDVDIKLRKGGRWVIVHVSMWVDKAGPTNENSLVPRVLVGTQDIFEPDGRVNREDDPNIPLHCIEVPYWCVYIPNGSVHLGKALFRNRHAFEQCLEHWNRQGRGTWNYTEEDPTPITGDDTPSTWDNRNRGVSTQHTR